MSWADEFESVVLGQLCPWGPGHVSRVLGYIGKRARTLRLSFFFSSSRAGSYNKNLPCILLLLLLVPRQLKPADVKITIEFFFFLGLPVSTF